MACRQEEFRVVDECGDLLVVDKPAGLLVHPTRPGGPRTLWDGLCGLLGYELANGGQVSLINRLDRETSGLVLVAKTSESAHISAVPQMLQVELRWPFLVEYLGSSLRNMNAIL